MSDEGLVATGSQTVGPFFHLGLANHAAPMTADVEGNRIRLTIAVTDGDGVPVPDAMLELWQRDGDTGICGFTRVSTGEDGTCEIETARTDHINVCFFSRGLLRQLYTRIYFESESGLETDPVLRLVPPERRATLMARRGGPDTRQWRFSLRLQGADETVFFDV